MKTRREDMKMRGWGLMDKRKKNLQSGDKLISASTLRLTRTTKGGKVLTSMSDL